MPTQSDFVKDLMADIKEKLSKIYQLEEEVKQKDTIIRQLKELVYYLEKEKK